MNPVMINYGGKGWHIPIWPLISSVSYLPSFLSIPSIPSVQSFPSDPSCLAENMMLWVCYYLVSKMWSSILYFSQNWPILFTCGLDLPTTIRKYLTLHPNLWWRPYFVWCRWIQTTGENLVSKVHHVGAMKHRRF